MTIFASRTAESMNTDTLPWEWIGNVSGAFSGRCSATVPEDARHAYHGVYSPQAKYTPATTHPANPILMDARNSIEASRKSELHPGVGMSSEGAIHVAIAFGIDAITYVPSRGITLDHVDHARKVLDRFARIYGKSYTKETA